MGIITSLIGGATFAVLSDQQTVAAQSLTAGTLKLNGSQAQSISIPTIGLTPGQTINGSFNVVNDGSLPLRYAVTANTSGNLFNSGDYNGDGSVDTNHAVVALTQNQTANIDGHGQSQLVRYSVKLPANAGNDFQNQPGRLSFTVSASQQDSSQANGWMIAQSPLTITKNTMNSDNTGHVDLSFTINGVKDGSINLGQDSLGDVKIIYGSVDAGNVFTPYLKGTTPLLVKSKAWSGYLNTYTTDKTRTQYSQGIGTDSSASYNNTLPMNEAISTTVDGRYATMAYADTEEWRAAVAAGNVAVKVVVTDNNGNTTEQIIKVE